MSKIEVNKAAEIIKSEQVEPATLRRIVEKMNFAVQPDGAEGDKPPAVKKQFVVIVSDPEGRMPKNDFVAWVVQIPESESPATALDRINRAAYDFNATKKGRLLPVKTVGEAIECVPSKFFKEADAWIKTKTPVLVVKTDNVIPRGDIDPVRAQAVSGFQKLADESGATIEIRSNGHIAKIEPSIG